ncbi:MAG: transcription antitermination factor NusB [Thermodesulfobacteriota bacterium]
MAAEATGARTAAQGRGTRRGGRRRAFEVLYGLTFVPAESTQALEFAFAETPRAADGDAGDRQDFAWELVRGVWDQRGRLDEIIARFSRHWKIARIARIELTILRLALYEILHLPDVPPRVAINEAVELAKRFGDENSKNFVNGILDAVARAVDDGTLGVR